MSVGIGSTGSLGLLVGSVSVERIVTAMVVWSQVGIAGYLIGPLAGGAVAASLGYAALGLVTTIFGLAILGVSEWELHRYPRPSLAGVAQLVRAPACHAGGRRFESGRSR